MKVRLALTNININKVAGLDGIVMKITIEDSEIGKITKIIQDMTTVKYWKMLVDLSLLPKKPDSNDCWTESESQVN